MDSSAILRTRRLVLRVKRVTTSAAADSYNVQLRGIVQSGGENRALGAATLILGSQLRQALGVLPPGLRPRHPPFKLSEWASHSGPPSSTPLGGSSTWRAGSSRDRSEGLSAADLPTGGPLEARLAGVVVAALKEVFDRDSVRLEMERSQIDAERRAG